MTKDDKTRPNINGTAWEVGMTRKMFLRSLLGQPIRSERILKLKKSARRSSSRNDLKKTGEGSRSLIGAANKTLRALHPRFRPTLLF